MCTCYISGRGKGFDMKTLKDASIGQNVKVKKLTGEGPVKRRIMDMGLTKGVEIYAVSYTHLTLPTRDQV